MNVLIVGANGFIGSNLAIALANHSDVRLSLLSRKFSQSLTRLEKNGVRLFQGSFTDPIILEKALYEQNLVYHLVSATVPSQSWETPLLEVEQNLIPTIKFLTYCQGMKVAKVVFASSGGTVYGATAQESSEDDPLAPFSPYGIVKASIEHFLEYFRVSGGLEYDVFRITNPYGPMLNKQGFGVINTWIKAALRGQEIEIWGDGDASKDYIYIKDVVTLIQYSLRSLKESGIFNVSSGQQFSLLELSEQILEVVGPGATLTFKSGKKSDNKTIRLSNQKILSHFEGFTFTPLKEGIVATMEYLQNEQIRKN